MLSGDDRSSLWMRNVCYITIISLFCSITPLNASDSDWQYSVDAGLKMSLSTFSNNWSGNNIGTFIWESDFEASIQKKLFKYLENEEKLNISYGQTSVQSKTDKRWSSLEKSEDEIEFLSTNKFFIGKLISPCISFQLNTQFIDDEEEFNKRYLNPLLLKESFGIVRAFGRRDKVFCNFRLSGALRQEINRFNEIVDDSTETIVGYNTIINKDGGAELVTEFRWKKADHFTITSKSTIFKALIRYNPENPPKNDYWKHPDVKWETVISSNITSFLQFTYYFMLHYDREIDDRIRYKQTLGVGLSLSFSN